MRVQASTSICDPTRPVCEDELELGQLLEQLAGKLGALADQHQHVGVAQAN
jgi:hypothetical protein